MMSRVIAATFVFAVQQFVCAPPGIAQATEATTGAASVPLPAAQPAVAANDEAAVPDPAKLTMPRLVFTQTPVDEADYDKYFYFHRENTSFAEAYGDIKECDALASGISFYMGADAGMTSAAMAQYGALAGGIGSAIGSVIADAIFGSAERRKQRRISLRNCMAFKEYHRYGLRRDLWDAFNFEEGMGRKREAEREAALQLQALVASGPAPTTGELGL